MHAEGGAFFPSIMRESPLSVASNHVTAQFSAGKINRRLLQRQLLGCKVEIHWLIQACWFPLGCGGKVSARISAMSRTVISPLRAAIPSLVMVKQNGHETHSVRVPVASASATRLCPTRLSAVSSNHILPPPAPQQEV